MCRKAQSEVHVVWLDNFSKFCAIAMQGVSSGAVAECLWTAHGLHRYVGPPVSTVIGALRGMPEKLCSPAAIAIFKQKMATRSASRISRRVFASA